MSDRTIKCGLCSQPFEWPVTCKCKAQSELAAPDCSAADRERERQNKRIQEMRDYAASIEAAGIADPYHGLLSFNSRRW